MSGSPLDFLLFKHPEFGPLKKCANPECQREFPKHWWMNYCRDCAEKLGVEQILPSGKPRFEVESDHELSLINRDQPSIEVRHADLTRTGDSPYRSECPACQIGILMVGRDSETYTLLKDDRCLLCGQRVRYTDIKKMRESLDGEMPPPKMSLNLVARELRSHIYQRRVRAPETHSTESLILLRAAWTLTAMVHDGMSNPERVAAIKAALDIVSR